MRKLLTRIQAWEDRTWAYLAVGAVAIAFGIIVSASLWGAGGIWNQ